MIEQRFATARSTTAAIASASASRSRIPARSSASRSCTTAASCTQRRAAGAGPVGRPRRRAACRRASKGGDAAPAVGRGAPSVPHRDPRGGCAHRDRLDLQGGSATLPTARCRLAGVRVRPVRRRQHAPRAGLAERTPPALGAPSARRRHRHPGPTLGSGHVAEALAAPTSATNSWVRARRCRAARVDCRSSKGRRLVHLICLRCNRSEPIGCAVLQPMRSRTAAQVLQRVPCDQRR